MSNSLAPQGCPSLSRIVDAVVSRWPEHAGYMAQRFQDKSDPTLPVAEQVASLVLKLTGEALGDYADAYRWLCGEMVAEDLHFRRTGRYRNTSFEQVFGDVYSNKEYMDRYLKGLLLSQVLWANQTAAFQFYQERFLARLPVNADLLEVGPGHGLLLYFAAPAMGTITGWDVSDSSLTATHEGLAALGIGRPVGLLKHDIHTPAPIGQAFDGIVVSEVLEHLEEPGIALSNLRPVLRPGGLLYVNVPIHSPAPDHIYQWDSPEAVAKLVEASGFSVRELACAATTGYDVERALRRKVTVNVLIVAGGT